MGVGGSLFFLAVLPGRRTGESAKRFGEMALVGESAGQRNLGAK
jgi:hypothetical protein